MRIIDKQGNEIASYDAALGYVVEEKLFIAHHSAVEAVEGVYHYEIIKEYPNGGKDVRKMWDVEPIEGVEAWDEYEDILRYIPFTPEEIAKREDEREEAERNSLEYRIRELEAQLAETQEALEMILSGVTE